MQNQGAEGFQLSVSEMRDLILRYKLFILVLTVIFGVLGMMMALKRTTTFQASKLIEIGQIDQKPGEIISQTILRVTQPTMIDEIMKSSPVTQIYSENDKNLLRSSLGVHPVKNTNFVQVEAKASSQENAKTFVEVVSDRFIQAHNRTLNPSIELIQKRIAEISQELEMAQGLTQEVEKKLARSSAGSLDRLFLATLLQMRKGERRQLEDRRMTLEEKIDPVRTFSTRAVGNVEVVELPLKPSRTLLVVMATLFGFFSATMIAFAHQFTHSKSKSEALLGQS